MSIVFDLNAINVFYTEITNDGSALNPLTKT